MIKSVLTKTENIFFLTQPQSKLIKNTIMVPVLEYIYGNIGNTAS